MKDLFGKAILDFQTNNSPEDLVTETSISDTDKMLVNYLFRCYGQMPTIEQTALSLSFGRVLDVGCGAGSHSLYLQNEKNLDVLGIDISVNAIKTCQLRGIKKSFNCNLLDLNDEKFDTILLLMNGTGIFQSLKKINIYLQKLKSLLARNGQILIDSSDLIYMYDVDMNNKPVIPKDKYYGEIIFKISYKNEIEEEFPWLYIDFELLTKIAFENNLKCELIVEGDNFDYLARLSI